MSECFPNCSECGADFLLHRTEDCRCPLDGKEAPFGIRQGWALSSYTCFRALSTTRPEPAAKEDK
jgi:hypothetical protein